MKIKALEEVFNILLQLDNNFSELEEYMYNNFQKISVKLENDKAECIKIGNYDDAEKLKLKIEETCTCFMYM